MDLRFKDVTLQNILVLPRPIGERFTEVCPKVRFQRIVSCGVLAKQILVCKEKRHSLFFVGLEQWPVFDFNHAVLIKVGFKIRETQSPIFR